MRKSSFTGWNISERKLGKEKDILPLLMEKKNGKGYCKKEVSILPGVNTCFYIYTMPT